jgi:hypothetical protein
MPSDGESSGDGVLASLVSIPGDSPRVGDVAGSSDMAVVGVDLVVPEPIGNRAIDGRDVVEIRDARDPGRNGEGLVGVGPRGFCKEDPATEGEIAIGDGDLSRGTVIAPTAGSGPA